MSNLSQFAVGDSGTINAICTRKVTICQGGGLLLNKQILGPCNLGCYYACGHVIALCSGSVKWIVSPRETEVSRTWYCRNDAVNLTIVTTGCTGWFVPTCGQLYNPGYTCRTYWDLYSSTYYWSSTESNSNGAWNVFFGNGNTGSLNKTFTGCVRAFRCVTY